VIGLVAQRHPIDQPGVSQARGCVSRDKTVGNSGGEYLAFARLPMPFSAIISKGWVYERDAKSALCERRVRLPEVPAIIRARKVDRGGGTNIEFK